MNKHEKLREITKRFGREDNVVISTACSDGGTEPLFPRLERAADNRIEDREATFSRYGIRANTARDNILEGLELLERNETKAVKRFGPCIM